LGKEVVDGPREFLGILAVGRGVRPGGKDVSTGHVVASFKATRESMLVQEISTARRRDDRTQRFKSFSVARPRGHGLRATPGEFLASFTVMSRPERSIPFIETDDPLDPLEGSPRRPRRPLCHFVAQRGSVQRVRRFGVSVERAGVKSVSFSGRASANQHVIVQVRLAVTIETVRETHHTLPARGVFAVLAAASITHHERVLLEIRHRGAHRRTMGLDDTSSSFGIKGQQDGDGPGRRDDDVVTVHLGSFAGDKDSLHRARIASVALAAQPPPWAALSRALEFARGVIGEVRHVVRAMRK
jgi:hypothetical protein